MGFLDDLSNSLLDQVGLAESKPGSLDSKRVGDFGSLGDFANKIDKSAQRQYLESGAIRNIRPRASEIISQEPDVTVLIKKRLFSSLQENYRAELLDKDELLFMRASKRLFENKCRSIAAYERLTKFERIVSKSDGIISDYALPSIFGAVDTLNNFGPTSSLINGKTQAVLDTIRKVKSFSDPNYFTTWIDDKTIPFGSKVSTGDGTGVIELTMVSSFSATNSTEFGGGSASITAEDPYKLMIVTNADIDAAISDASSFGKSSFFKTSEFQLEKSINDLKRRLNETRIARRAAPIRFIISENTVLFKKVRAVIDGAVTVPGTQSQKREIEFSFSAGSFGVNLFSFENDSVQIDPIFLQDVNGLLGAEAGLFKQIVNNIYTLIGLKHTTRSQIRQFNKETNRVRKKMRLHYGNKPIIQPMDVVTIFVSTKTVNDAKVIQGLKFNYTDDSLLNSINQTASNIESSLSDIASTFSGGGAGGNYLENEKNAIAGPGFPTWLWNLMRNDFTRQSAGTCVFTGIINSSSHSYGGGKYTLKVNAKDNSSYFTKSKININPGLDVPNSALYDPLTPFKLELDQSSGFLRGEVPELLDVNKRLLNSNSIRSKLGVERGKPLNSKEYNKRRIEFITAELRENRDFDDFGQQFRRIFTDPDGFVYRWKEGIGSLVFSGQPYTDLGSFRSEASPNITKNPFAGQGVMNILSLLITGQPYDYNTFLRGAFKSASLNSDDVFKADISESFFKGLISDVTRQNPIWGNFIPFKKLVVNDREYEFMATGEFDISNRNRGLSKLLKERAKVFDELTTTGNQFNNTPMFYKKGIGGSVEAVDDPALLSGQAFLINKIRDLDVEINKQKTAFEESRNKLAAKPGSGTLRISGNDISFDPSFTEEEGEGNETQRSVERAEFRKKINYLTQRRLWQVKGNEDRNFFIVDDTYDKNYDIQEFEFQLGKMELFNNTFSSMGEQIKTVGTILGLEVFADSQGHVRARPPQYNRMPSSVFRDMLQKKEDQGIKVFPEFLESLFFNNVQGYVDRLEIIEDQIRLRAAALGALTDEAASKLISGGTFSVGINSFFQFLTNEISGKFGGTDIRSLFRQNDPDLQESESKGALDRISSEVKHRLNATVNFDIARRTELFRAASVFSSGNDVEINNKIQKIAERLRQRIRSNNIPSNINEILSSDRKGARNQVGVLRVLTKIAGYVADRQKIMKSLAAALRHLSDGLDINRENEDSPSAIKDAFKNFAEPNLSREIPELLESMIEDENFDDLGVGSGRRYILDDAKVISYDISENEPPYNAVQVDGKLAQGLIPNSAAGIEFNGGNALTTAWAVDYDLWQMYGFRSEKNVVAPFFSDAATQCAPYAVSLLNLARKQIFNGTITSIGNEFIQAGEVYYLEDRDLLFYATSVTHSFTYNNSYTTSLQVTFGRNPGEYIPTQLDIIGKGLYSHRHQAELVRHVRHERADGYSHLTILTRDTSEPIFEGEFNNVKNLVNGKFGEQNRKNLSNMLLSTTGLLTPTSLNQVLNIEIRIYKNTHPSINAKKSNTLEKVANSVKSWVTNPSKLSLDGSVIPDPDSPLIDAKHVSVITIDLNPEVSETRSPSAQAWAMARNNIAVDNLPLIEQAITAFAEAGAQKGVPISESQQSDIVEAEQAKREVKSLINTIIDIWITFSDKNDVIEGNKKTGSPSNQSEKENQEKLDQANLAAQTPDIITSA